MKLQKLYFSLELTQISFTFFQCDVTATPIQNHFQQKIDRAPLDHDGEENNYHAPNFIARLAQYFLPHAALWSGLMLGIFCKFCFKSVVIYKNNILTKYSMSLLSSFTFSLYLQGILAVMVQAQHTSISARSTKKSSSPINR